MTATRKRPKQDPDNEGPLLNVRGALIFLLAFVIAICVGILAYIESLNAAHALLVAIGMFAMATHFGMKIIG